LDYRDSPDADKNLLRHYSFETFERTLLVSQNSVTHGLYELKAKTGISVATLVPVHGTLTTHERGAVLPDETFDRLWGADGDELVVQRYGDGWGISWTKVVAFPPTSA
jgi:hypothetical protein